MNLLKNCYLIFGGAFDPPHFGHIAALNDAIAYLNPLRTFVTVSSTQKIPKISYEHRFELSKIAFSNAQVVNWEKDQNIHATTTLLTYAKNQLACEAKQLVFCIGSDQFLNLETWVNYPKIISQANWLVLKRKGSSNAEIEKQRKKMAPYFKETQLLVSETNAPEVSSSQIRSLLERKMWDDARKLVPDAIIDYLRSKGL